uniref:ADP-ribosylation factor-like 10 n=1 Tax=Amphiprion ocellaris TaxID=80972 RepID=A0AAQ5X0Z3_AMPOC
MVLLRHISIALTAAVAALGSALFIALNYFYKRRIWSPQAEYCTIKEEEEERGKRQVLVLGLDGAGKSSMLQGLTPGEAKRGRCRPTRGFNFMSLDAPACQLDFLEIGGGEDLRRYWMDYLRRTHVLVYVVDSSDRSRLPLAKAELHRLLRVEPQLPVVVLGNKQSSVLVEKRVTGVDAMNKPTAEVETSSPPSIRLLKETFLHFLLASYFLTRCDTC